MSLEDPHNNKTMHYVTATRTKETFESVPHIVKRRIMGSNSKHGSTFWWLILLKADFFTGSVTYK
jgi:hypothetical protein